MDHKQKQLNTNHQQQLTHQYIEKQNYNHQETKQFPIFFDFFSISSVAQLN